MNFSKAFILTKKILAICTYNFKKKMRGDWCHFYRAYSIQNEVIFFGYGNTSFA